MPTGHASFLSPSLRLAGATLLVVLAACGEGGTAPPRDTTGTTPPPRGALSLTPPRAVLQAGESIRLVASEEGATAPVTTGLTWRVALVPSLTAVGVNDAGTVDAQGTYAVPASLSRATTVTVTATHADGRSAAARIALSPHPDTGEWRSFEPRVVEQAAPQRTVVTLRTLPEATNATLTFGTQVIALERFDETHWRTSIDGALLLRELHPGSGHGNAGFLEIAMPGGKVQMGIGGVVRETTMPAVAISALGADAQRSTHVLNLRVDDWHGAGRPPESAIRRAYEYLGDNYDFLSVVAPVQVTGNRYYLGVRNAVRGLGLPLYDNGAQWGSAARLEGIVVFPLDPYYDAGEYVMSHEIGHRWINFGTNTSLRKGRPHWPISTLASGVMGFSIPGSGAGGNFRYRPVDQGDGTWRLDPVGAEYGEFNDLELYLMGLAPASEVGTHWVFDNQDQMARIQGGGPLMGPVTPVTIDSIVAVDGPRVPAYDGQPKTWRVATIVMSNGRLLTPSEMAHFDHMTARGAAEVELPYSIGFARGTTKPFFLATRGRGRLDMRLAQ